MTVRYQQKGDIAVVEIDNPPVNATSQEVRQGLLNAVKACEEDEQISSVVLFCTGRTFVAGADIREFGKPPVEPHLPDVLLAIENSTKPWFAAIHGTALGGGLELAMVCRARVASADAKMGMPEVNLGLIPGAGGTVRLPRLVAPEFALNMIASGKPVSASKALSAGLIDKIVDEDLVEAAIAYARSLQHDLPKTLARNPKLPEDASRFEIQKATFMAKGRLQNSVVAAIAAVDRALELEPLAALREERLAFENLKSSQQSNALRHIFFAERATLSDPRTKAEKFPIDQIGVIGGGTMGAGIAAACLLAGLHVTMIEAKEEAAELGKSRVLTILTDSSNRGLISNDKLLTLEASFEVSTDYQSLSKTDLVIEAVFEDMAVKKSVFEQLDRNVSQNAILATNTSYLDVNEISRYVSNPSRVIGLHFFSPAHIMKLLEIVVPDSVSAEVIATVAGFSKRLKKIAVLSGVCDGFIGNRIMSAYRKEADFLIEDGAYPHDVDKAMREFGFPMGIFEMQDLAGLDISWAMRKRKALTRDPEERYVEIADRLCEQGRLGRKTGKGWYIYDSGKPEIDPEVTGLIDSERTRKNIKLTTLSAHDIMHRILSSMQSEAERVLAEGIALKDDDIDVVMTSGYGFPRWRGGPMFMKNNP
ncbi:MAG: 3-hydroxyacyl-CoA dehydrogenase NAD-binding domain-containing protein [Salaquimonas sp.]